MAKKLEKKGVPAYMVTLGDMWSLMLTFFIMLFAMSEVDATKFKKVEGTLKNTFGFRQTLLQYGPPPGVNPVHATSASDNFPDDIIFDHPTQNSINDPEFSARKIVSCEKQVKKNQTAQLITKKNGSILKKVFFQEIKDGVLIYSESSNEASIVFSESEAFTENKQMRSSMKKTLSKLNETLSVLKGEISVRSYLPKDHSRTYFQMAKDSSLQSALIGDALNTDSFSVSKNIRLEVVPFSQHQRTPSSQGFSPDSSFFEIVIIKN